MLYLHIGMNKTGTSAIQRFLSAHDAELRSNGTLYPATGRRGDAHYGISQALGFAHRRDRNAATTAVERMAADLRQELATSGCNAAVISSEDFVIPGNVKAVAEFFRDYDCRIVLYLRRHDHWWLSAWNQAVRMVVDPPWPSGGIQSYLRFQRNRKAGYGNFRRLVERWSDVFGNDRMTVRPFEAEQNPRGVVADFVQTIGLTDLTHLAARQTDRVNESAGADALYMLDIIQRATLSTATRDRLKAAILSSPDQGPRSIDQIMPPALRRRVILENSDDYAWIARTFLGREDGRLFLEPEPEADPQWRRADLPTPEQTLARIVGFIEPV